MNFKKLVFIGMALAFFTLGFISLQRALPEHKEERIYKEITIFSPYKFEKAVGGLSIVNTQTGKKEKPDAASVMHRMDELQKEWGKSHLLLTDKAVIVLNDQGVEIKTIAFKTPLERKWVKQFYGLTTKKSTQTASR